MITGDPRQGTWRERRALWRHLNRHHPITRNLKAQGLDSSQVMQAHQWAISAAGPPSLGCQDSNRSVINAMLRYLSSVIDNGNDAQLVCVIIETYLNTSPFATLNNALNDLDSLLFQPRENTPETQAQKMRHYLEYLHQKDTIGRDFRPMKFARAGVPIEHARALIDALTEPVVVEAWTNLTRCVGGNPGWLPVLLDPNAYGLYVYDLTDTNHPVFPRIMCLDLAVGPARGLLMLAAGIKECEIDDLAVQAQDDDTLRFLAAMRTTSTNEPVFS